jgi:hypothetical protein
MALIGQCFSTLFGGFGNRLIAAHAPPLKVPEFGLFDGRIWLRFKPFLN